MQWRVRVGTRRLVSTGRDLIEFHWGVKYVGPRPPLIMQRPAFTDGWPGSTRAEFYAFPPGQQKGRWVTLPDTDDRPAGFSLIRDRPNPEWFLTAARGQWESGRDAIPVADVKAVLQARFPGEFPADRPPKLYTRLIHRALLRDADAWTGELESEYLEVPDLKNW